MMVPHRKPVTARTTEELQAILKPFYGNNRREGYFIGSDFGPGWNDIVLALHTLLSRDNPNYFIAQIKEKFGGLRYYIGGEETDVGALISEAEALSYQTCEECGRPGILREDLSWITTLCDYDHKIYKINNRVWRFQFAHLRYFFRSYFATNRWLRKWKRSAKNGNF
jgi:hypothetical protein